MLQTQRPSIGVGVIVIKEKKVLLGKRKNAHGAGFWSFAGGHLEYNETLQDCVKREVFEETGLRVDNLKPGPYTQDFYDNGKHYITLFWMAEVVGGHLENKEPNKCEGWHWFDWEKMPEPLFLPIQNLLKQGFQPAF